MRNITLLILFTIQLCNAQVNSTEKDYSLARVGKQVYGVYMFVNSQPFHSYEYVATVTVDFQSNSSQNFESIVEKAKKKYPYFNGMIFHNDNYNKVDLIKFADLEVSRGGFKVNDHVTFISYGKMYYGTIVELESQKDKASVKYENEKGKFLIREVYYGELTPITSDQFNENTSSILKSEVSDFKVNQEVTYTNESLLFGNSDRTGIITKLNDSERKALVKSKDSTRWISYSDLK